ncbi:ATP-binding protein [Streptomyces sp. NBC_00690]|uniref:ATP-binding protein n=1 Tax=Streptomyces sp. NBC_00690 TaxID=2975808 RepID=UPI002E2CA6AD|nr:ATP-binding protein [Streptomyces sp. NBC_00690]
MATEPSSSVISEPAYKQNMPRKPESARTARQMVSTALDAWGLGEAADAAHLVVTELVANAVQHARLDTILVTTQRRDAFTVRVAVVDRSRETPQRHHADEDEEHGRGLELIQVLSHGHWGVDPLPWGKRVWADLGIASRPGDPGGAP